MTFFPNPIVSLFVYCRCAHKLEALKATEMATQHQIAQSILEELTDAQRHMIKQKYGDNNLVVYSLPGENICVPTIITEDSGDNFTHVKSGKVSFGHMQILLLGFFYFFIFNNMDDPGIVTLLSPKATKVTLFFGFI